jgi:hypothetical protein
MEDRDEIYVESGKVQKVLDWPKPTCVSHICQFLGLTGFYRWFVDGYAAIAKLLYKATNKTLAAGTRKF